MSDTRDTNEQPRTDPATRSAVAEDMTAYGRPEDDTISLLDLLTVLARRWRLIFFTTFFAAVGIVLFSLYTIRMPSDSPYNPLPNFYRPEAQILLTDPSSSGGIASVLGDSELGILSGLAGLGGSARTSSADLAMDLLKGNTIVDPVVDEFDLVEQYADAEAPRTAARKSIRDSMQATFNEASGIMTVTFEHIDPVYATNVLQRLVTLLEARFTYLTRDDARSRAEAIQRQADQLEEELEAARAALINFQRRYGIVDPESQGRQTVDLIARFRMQIFEQELEREQLLRLVEDRNDPQIQRIDRNISRIRGLISELESGFRTYSRVSIPLNEIAGLTAQYTDLRRDLLLKEQVYSTFQGELIRSRIQSQDTTRRFQVIEPPELPEVKAGPSRGVISVIVTVTAFFLSVFVAFILEYFSRAKDDPADAKKLQIIKDQFRLRRRA